MVCKLVLTVVGQQGHLAATRAHRAGAMRGLSALPAILAEPHIDPCVGSKQAGRGWWDTPGSLSHTLTQQLADNEHNLLVQSAQCLNPAWPTHIPSNISNLA